MKQKDKWAEEWENSLPCDEMQYFSGNKGDCDMHDDFLCEAHMSPRAAYQAGLEKMREIAAEVIDRYVGRDIKYEVLERLEEAGNEEVEG